MNSTWSSCCPVERIKDWTATHFARQQISFMSATGFPCLVFLGSVHPVENIPSKQSPSRQVSGSTKGRKFPRNKFDISANQLFYWPHIRPLYQGVIPRKTHP